MHLQPRGGSTCIVGAPKGPHFHLQPRGVQTYIWSRGGVHVYNFTLGGPHVHLQPRRGGKVYTILHTRRGRGAWQEHKREILYLWRARAPFVSGGAFHHGRGALEILWVGGGGGGMTYV